MLRRDFLKQSAAVAALASLPLSCSPIPPASRFAMGLQLYTVRDAMEKDRVGTLKALKEMGYLHFESYGYEAKAKTYYGYEPEASEMERCEKSETATTDWPSTKTLSWLIAP